MTVNQSHGGSGKQARAVIDGLEADVVTLAMSYDIDAIQSKSGRIAENWQQRLPDDSVPFTSTVVFVVRKGNPLGIHDWSDLVKPGVTVVTANPKTSGGARWNYLAAWGYALRANGGDEAKAKEFVRTLYQNVPVLDSGARGSTVTFAQRGIGQVLIAWENEAHLLAGEMGGDKFEIVDAAAPASAPSRRSRSSTRTSTSTARARSPRRTSRFSTRPRARRSAPSTTTARATRRSMQRHAAEFPNLQLFTVDEIAGGWQKAQAAHFADGGIFDQIYRPGT